jgi:hypothetical protein
MKLIKQSKLLTFQVIVSLIILNTQISFAQNKKINLKDWEGSYVGIGVANLHQRQKFEIQTEPLIIML